MLSLASSLLAASKVQALIRQFEKGQDKNGGGSKNTIPRPSKVAQICVPLYFCSSSCVKFDYISKSARSNKMCSSMMHLP